MNDLKNEYMDLFLKRNQIIKDGEDIYRMYITIFGDYHIKKYKISIEIIKIRKMIAYCISKLNYGEKIYQNDLDNYIDNEMKTYEYELESMIQERDSILNAPIISDYRVRECKKLYYAIAKKIHPDIRIGITDELINIFKEATVAYHNNDYDKLKSIYDYVILLDDGEIDEFELEDKIEKLKQEIDRLLSEEPYILKYEYIPLKAKEDKIRELEAEIENDNKVLEQLKDKLNEFDIDKMVA